MLAAAEAEFAARGFGAASYNGIIKAAGLSKGAMYYYFADKADLYRTVIERALSRFSEATGDLEPFSDAPGFWAEVRALSLRALQAVASAPELAGLGRSIYDEGGSRDFLGDLVTRSEDWCTRVLLRGQAVGAVRADIPLDLLATAATGLLAQCDRWFALHMETLAPAELERLTAVCLDMIEQIASPPT